MKRFFPIVFVFGWFFLVQGYGTSTNSTGFSTVVGPFPSQETCAKVARESKKSTGGHVKFRVSSCWEAQK